MKKSVRWPKTFVDKTGRVCTKCSEYKLWNEYSISRKTLFWYTSICKWCKAKHQVDNYTSVKGKKWIATASKIKYAERKLNEVSWNNVEEKPYYDTSNLVQVWMSPFKAFFDKRNLIN